MSKKMNIENVVIDGVNMVRISMGSESELYTTDEAFGLAEVMQDIAGMPASLSHIDSVFENWGDGDDGGTC